MFRRLPMNTTMLPQNQPPQPYKNLVQKRFNKEAMKVPNHSDCEHIQAYKNGIRSLLLTEVLATKTLLTIDDLLDPVHEFIKGEISIQRTGRKPYRSQDTN
ncbi:hypothetical protein M9H77_12542 [Catharanthus roseus]|uniref:Uncharacterized protein n=1 Tax=Catharanthus roseus TaxID=4058 RepID=A0ACC0BHV0_CATRO|nr:hypothetical protein M9H77_12542 [Catharanthus roseus]